MKDVFHVCLNSCVQGWDHDGVGGPDGAVLDGEEGEGDVEEEENEARKFSQAVANFFSLF